MEFTAEMIASFFAGEIVGDKEVKVSTIAKIEEGTPGSLSFLSNEKYEKYIYNTEASIVIVNNSFNPSEPIKATLIKVEDAYSCFAKLLELYSANKVQKTGISDKAAISDSATLGEGCYVGQFAVIGDNVKIGKNCKIYPQVFIDDNSVIGDDAIIYAGVKIYHDIVIGNRAIIHAGAVIGSDGFGFAPNEKGEFSKIPQIGNVVIEDDVEIGANTCIDRSTMGSTLIKKGVKLDNAVHLAHNVVIGENTVIAAQVGIAGSCKVGANCMMGGQVGIAGHLTVGNNVKLGSKAGVSNNIADGLVHMGFPSLPTGKFSRSNAVYRNLPKLSDDVHTLKKEMAKLKEE